MVFVVSFEHFKTFRRTVSGVGGHAPLKVKLHYAYKVRNIGRVRPRLRFCVLC